jgi:hypothetical protein
MMSSVFSAVLMVGAMAPTSTPVFVDDDYVASREATVSVAGATRARVIARAGTLVIQGRKDLREIRARGTARSSNKKILHAIELTAVRVGDAVEVRVEMPETGWRDRATLDLVVEIPADLPLDVEDSDGDATIRGVASVDVQDGPGTLDVDDVAGGVRIADGTGDIRVARVGRDLVVSNDDGGDITYSDVRGTITIPKRRWWRLFA